MINQNFFYKFNKINNIKKIINIFKKNLFQQII